MHLFGRDLSREVAIIAEVGINHEGSVDMCARLIEEAGRAGADAMKLQTMDAEENYVRGSESYELFSRSALTPEETARMFELARACGMEPFTTAGDFATIDWVDRLDPCAHKISSGLLNNLPAVRHAARTGRPVLLSTGMASTEDVDAAVAAAREGGGRQLGLFQCTSVYPAPPHALNLATIRWLERRHGIPTGFSDHSVGTLAATLSVAAGATMVEKHFTLDTTRPGYDHRVSLDAKGFAELVQSVRAAETMMGRPEKRREEVEEESARKMRRILVARRDVAAGALFDSDNLGLKRPMPGTPGLHPRHYEQVLGRRAVRALRRDDPVTAGDVEGSL